MLPLFEGFFVFYTLDKMIKLEDFKKILIKNGITNLSEQQIIELRDNQDQMAEILFNLWVDSIKNKSII